MLIEFIIIDLVVMRFGRVQDLPDILYASSLQVQMVLPQDRQSGCPSHCEVASVINNRAEIKLNEIPTNHSHEGNHISRCHLDRPTYKRSM